MHAIPVYEEDMRIKNKDKIEVYLTIDQKDRTREYAKTHGVSMAEVIKRALEVLLRE